MTRTPAIRRRSILVTWIVAPATSIVSPTTARRPSLSVTKPAIVSDDPRGQGQARGLLEVLQVEPAVEFAARCHGVGRGVVLVEDLADDLLDQVLERDDAVGAAVLVDHDGDLVAVRPHPRERRKHPRGRREVRDRAHEAGERTLGVIGGRLEQVAHVHEADDVVDRLVHDGVAGERQLAHLRDGVDEGAPSRRARRPRAAAA